jgi:hypothetical protein
MAENCGQTSQLIAAKTAIADSSIYCAFVINPLSSRAAIRVH